jgi:hypothetical protein
MRHPFNENNKEGASANDTDWLLRTPEGELVIQEVKWQRNVADAIRKGETQVGMDFDENPTFRGERIAGAYIAIMDWDVDDRPVKVHVKRVRPVEGDE